MALTTQEDKFIQDLTAKALEVRNMQLSFDTLVARWNLNDFFNQLDDADIAVNYPHLDKSKLANCINALLAVDTALGDDVSGQTTNLIKMQG